MLIKEDESEEFKIKKCVKFLSKNKIHSIF